MRRRPRPTARPQYAAALKSSNWKDIVTYGKQMAAKKPDDLLVHFNILVAGSQLATRPFIPTR
jgi:hypothetical protein